MFNLLYKNGFSSSFNLKRTPQQYHNALLVVKLLYILTFHCSTEYCTDSQKVQLHTQHIKHQRFISKRLKLAIQNQYEKKDTKVNKCSVPYQVVMDTDFSFTLFQTFCHQNTFPVEEWNITYQLEAEREWLVGASLKGECEMKWKN